MTARIQISSLVHYCYDYNKLLGIQGVVKQLVMLIFVIIVHLIAAVPACIKSYDDIELDDNRITCIGAGWKF